METLFRVRKILEVHITKAVDEWESELARKEATILDNEEEIARFLDGKD
jgi:hypothetical protein